jgi:HPt (histidine-containing phosphotransfer) domain-containing protein
MLERFAAEVDDPATVAAVVDAYLAQMPRRREEVLAALSRGDLAAAADIGHALGPSSAMLGARRLPALAAELEHAARAGRPEEVRATTARLVRECGAVEADLRAWRRAAPA